MTTSFNDLLDKPAEGITRPPPWPEGTFLLRIAKVTTEIAQNEQKTPMQRVLFDIMRPGEDVDPETMAAFTEKLGKAQARHDFFLTEDALYRLVEFLELAGVSRTGKTTRQMLSELPGKFVYGHFKQTPDKKEPDVIRSNINSFAKVE